MEILENAWNFLAGNVVEISTAATALFTGLMAWVAWQQSKAKLIAEWEFSSVWEATPTVRVVVRNGMPYSVRPTLINAGPTRFIVDVQPGGRERKHESWKPTMCPVTGIREILPGQSSAFSFTVTINSEAVQRQQMQLPAKLRRFVAMLAWKSLSARVHHGASVHFQITIDSNVSTSFRRRIKATMRIPLTAAEKQIADKAKIENKS